MVFISLEPPSLSLRGNKKQKVLKNSQTVTLRLILTERLGINFPEKDHTQQGTTSEFSCSEAALAPTQLCHTCVSLMQAPAIRQS